MSSERTASSTRARVSYAAAARPASDSNERELVLVAVHGDVSKIEAVHVLQHLRMQKQYDANGKINGFHSEASFKIGDSLRRRFRMTFASKAHRDDFVEMFRAPLSDADKLGLPDSLKNHAGPCLRVQFKLDRGQFDCFIDIIEPHKREQLLVVKVANVKPLVSDSVVEAKFSYYGTVVRVQRLHFKDFPLIENGVRLVFLKDLKTHSFIPPSLFIAGQRVSVRYEGQWAITPCSNCKEKGHLRRKCPNPCSVCGTRCQDTEDGCPGAASPSDDIALEQEDQQLGDDAHASEPHLQTQIEPLPQQQKPTEPAVACEKAPKSASVNLENPEFPSLKAAAALDAVAAQQRKRKVTANQSKSPKAAVTQTLNLSDSSTTDGDMHDVSSASSQSDATTSPPAKQTASQRPIEPPDGKTPSRDE